MDLDKTIQSLRKDTELSIIRLAEPLFTSKLTDDKNVNRISNASSIASDATRDPAVLKADLQHYRDLFSKLRFSYVEQVTKEKFLKSVTEDTPQLVTSEENRALDERNRESKADLSDKKEDLRGMLADLEAQARELARRWHEIELQTTQLEMLPVELGELDSRIAELEAAKEPQSEDAEMRLPLQETLALLAEREREAASLDAQIQALHASIPVQQQELQSLEDELVPLQQRRDNAVEYMRAAKDLKKEDGISTAAEYQGRWLANSEAALKLMLEV